MAFHSKLYDTPYWNPLLWNSHWIITQILASNFVCQSSAKIHNTRMRLMLYLAPQQELWHLYHLLRIDHLTGDLVAATKTDGTSWPQNEYIRGQSVSRWSNDGGRRPICKADIAKVIQLIGSAGPQGTSNNQFTL